MAQLRNTTSCRAILVLAESESEALDIAYKRANEFYSASEGYYPPSAAVNVVPDEFIVKAYQSLDKGNDNETVSQE
jgi:hypothetical protein